jgi:hypothetical protein
MKLIQELVEISEAAVGKTTAQKVYHRDYIRSKKKPYRKYHPDDYKKRVKESVDELIAELHVPNNGPLQSGNDSTTEAQLRLRTALIDHLQAHDKDMSSIQNALSLDKAAVAARNIIQKHLHVELPVQSLVDQVSEAIARAYWNK